MNRSMTTMLLTTLLIGMLPGNVIAQLTIIDQFNLGLSTLVGVSFDRVNDRTVVYSDFGRDLRTFSRAMFSQSAAEKDIQSAMKQYEAKAAEARKRLLSAFDQYANVIQRSGIDRESIASRLVANADQRRAFEEYNALPADEAITPALFDYAVLMHQAQMPLVKAYDAAYKKAIDKNDVDTLRFLTNEKAKVDKAMKSREQFRAGTVWEGFRNQTTKQLIDPKKPKKGTKLVQSQYTLKMKVNAESANSFEGNFEQNIQYGNHPEFKVNGQMQGTFIKWWIETPVNAAPRKHLYSGYVLGDRIIGRLDGFTPNGEPLVAFFRLTKKN